MTPKELCKYIIDGKIFKEIGSGDADFFELGRYIWPQRYEVLVTLAKNAILTTAAPDSESVTTESATQPEIEFCETCGTALSYR